MDLVCDSRNVLARKRFAGDEEWTFTVLGEQLEELDKSNVQMIADCLN